MKWLLRLVGLVVVLALFAVSLVLLLPADRLGKIASDQLSAVLGRDVRMQEVSVSVFPLASLDVTGFEIANADWAGETPFLTADRAKIRIDGMAAFQGDVLIEEVTVQAPVVSLVSTEDGRANWDFGSGEASGASGSDDASSGSQDAALRKLVVEDGDITLALAGQPRERLQDVDLTLDWPDASGPAALDVALTRDGLRASANAQIENPQGLLAGEVVPVALTAGTQGGQVAFDGLLGTTPQLQGNMTLDASDLSALAKSFGASLPAGIGNSARFSGDVYVTEAGAVSVRNGTLSVAAHDISLEADVAFEERPRVNARISTPRLDLSRFLQSGSGDSGGGSSSEDEGWSTEAIDASALALFNGEIAFAAGSAVLGDLKFGKTDTVMTLTRSRAVFQLRELQAYEGLITGEFVANNRSGLSVGGNLSVIDVAMEPFLTDVAGIDRFSGDGRLSLSFLGVGQSVQAIMSSLKGDGTVRSGRGIISGIDLDRIFSGDTSPGGTTVFDTLDASFTIESGVLRNDDLRMGLPRLEALGDGKVDLGRRSIDYLLTVRSPDTGVAIPVRVKGPWSGPAIRPDLGELIDQNFEKEKEELKQKAREEITERVEKELGVTVEEGEDLEDVLRRKLEEEATKGLLDLFD